MGISRACNFSQCGVHQGIVFSGTASPAGGLIGVNYSPCKLSQVYVGKNVTVMGAIVASGGLIGESNNMLAKEISIDNSYVLGTLTSSFANCSGGILGNLCKDNVTMNSGIGNKFYKFPSLTVM